MEQKIKINWAISYLLLWELFLMAKGNPSFSNPFVKNHSKNATKIHFIFLIIILVYKYFIQNYLSFSFNIINKISIWAIIESIIYWIFIILLIRWSYKAFSWIEASEIQIKKDYLKIDNDIVTADFNETQKMIYIASYIPFFWLIIWARFNNPINRYGAKISWLFSIILIFFIVTKHSEVLLLSLFIYLCFVVYAGISIVTNQTVIFTSLFSSIPSLWEVYLNSRAWVSYIFESVKIIFGKKDEVSFNIIKKRTIENDKKFIELASSYLTGDKILFWNKLIYIPIINIIYLPKFFFDKKSRYSLALAQWFLITIIIVILYFFFPNAYLKYVPIMLFPIFLWIANIDHNPFYRIPIIYDIYLILDNITFWIFSKIKFLKEKKEEVQELSFKV